MKSEVGSLRRKYYQTSDFILQTSFHANILPKLANRVKFSMDFD